MSLGHLMPRERRAFFVLIFGSVVAVAVSEIDATVGYIAWMSLLFYLGYLSGRATEARESKRRAAESQNTEM